MIQGLFPEGVIALEADPAMWDAPLPPEEARWVEHAVPKRRREFAAGRHCARAALARLGFPPCAIPSGLDRAPRWPAGIVGSISHDDGLCVVAVAPRRIVASLGLDVERADGIAGPLAPLVCDARELARARAASGLTENRAAALIFSAKESVYKCVYPLTRTRWGFEDVEIVLEAGEGTFTAILHRAEDRLPERVAGRFALGGSRVFAAVTLPVPA